MNKRSYFKKRTPHFQMVWDIRKGHCIPGLPYSYIFFLKCCFERDCKHPVCQLGPPDSGLCWYPVGPPVSHLPLPVPDATQPRGSQECHTCPGVCLGYYSNPLVDVTDPAALKSVAKPPSLVLKQKFSDLGNQPVT